ncbi:5971_t:CDS:2, partial [Cetraspora pellucida]
FEKLAELQNFLKARNIFTTPWEVGISQYYKTKKGRSTVNDEKIQELINQLYGIEKERSENGIDVAALERMRQPDYHQKSRGLMPDATPTDRAKYEMQQNILRYKRENDISNQDLKKVLGIKTKRRLECLLFAHIDNFSLDELIEYASKLFGDFKLKIVRPGEEIHPLPHYPKKNGRPRKHL